MFLYFSIFVYLFVAIQIAAMRCRIIALVASKFLKARVHGVMTTEQCSATKDTVAYLCKDMKTKQIFILYSTSGLGKFATSTTNIAHVAVSVVSSRVEA